MIYFLWCLYIFYSFLFIELDKRNEFFNEPNFEILYLILFILYRIYCVFVFSRGKYVDQLLICIYIDISPEENSENPCRVKRSFFGWKFLRNKFSTTFRLFFDAIISFQTSLDFKANIQTSINNTAFLLTKPKVKSFILYIQNNVWFKTRSLSNVQKTK